VGYFQIGAATAEETTKAVPSYGASKGYANFRDNFQRAVY
jgi:hypothetical protein